MTQDPLSPDSPDLDQLESAPHLGTPFQQERDVISLNQIQADLIRLDQFPSPDSFPYVALGDSYSAGNGAAALSGDWCRQATEQSWPQYVANWLQAVRWGHAACSGYTIADVIYKGQLKMLSVHTKWVTITVGGNDIGFESTLRICVLFNRHNCFAAVAEARYHISYHLAGNVYGCCLLAD